eukprot:5333814-Amphidinium_carterae.1
MQDAKRGIRPMNWFVLCFMVSTNCGREGAAMSAHAHTPQCEPSGSTSLPLSSSLVHAHELVWWFLQLPLQFVIPILEATHRRPQRQTTTTAVRLHQHTFLSRLRESRYVCAHDFGMRWGTPSTISIHAD